MKCQSQSSKPVVFDFLLYLIPYVMLPVVPDSICYVAMLNRVIAVTIGSRRMGAPLSDTVGRDQSPVGTH